MDNDWYDNNEPPPVGEVVEYHVTSGVYVKCKVLAVDEDKLWLKTIEPLEGYLKYDSVGSRLVSSFEFVRPLRTETDKLVERMVDIFGEAACKQDYSMKRGMQALYEAGYRKINPMSRYEVISKIFGLTDDIDMVGAATLYDAGFRFLDQGE